MSGKDHMDTLPPGWHLARFDEILQRIERKFIIDDSASYNTVGVRWYGQGAFVRETLLGMNISRKQQWIIKSDDIVYNKLFAWKGSFAIADESVESCIVSDKFPTYKAKTELIDIRFLKYYFLTNELAQKAQDLSKGAAAISKLTLNPPQFWDLTIPLPPIEEQRRIVARIEDLAARIEEARELRQRAVGEADALIAATISNLHFDENCWTRVKTAVLDRKGAVRSGPFGSQLHHEEFVDSGVVAIGTRDVQVNRFILNSGWHITPEKFEQFRRYQVFPGDLLTTIVGASIGRFCVVPSDVPLAFTTKHVMALTLDHNIAEPRFISYMLNFHKKCRESIFAQTEGSAQPSLNATKVLKSTIPLPSIPEQQSILAQLDALQSKTDALKCLQKETAAELDALNSSILDRAFRGEL